MGSMRDAIRDLRVSRLRSARPSAFLQRRALGGVRIVLSAITPTAPFHGESPRSNRVFRHQHGEASRRRKPWFCGRNISACRSLLRGRITFCPDVCEQLRDVSSFSFSLSTEESVEKLGLENADLGKVLECSEMNILPGWWNW